MIPKNQVIFQQAGNYVTNFNNITGRGMPLRQSDNNKHKMFVLGLVGTQSTPFGLLHDNIY